MKLVKPKKFLGQHFLKDLKVAQDIADTVDTFPELPILAVSYTHLTLPTILRV